uniref:Late embryogenesis abundant protein LEA-2 subgroup domain-containing protein n=1 Tax=Oryza rufipogon TaxID=4529 RepID=A0A0E0PG12_ORYRU
MSVIKDCGGHKGCECEKEKVHRRLCWALVALVLLTLFIVLVVWLALRPHKPRFYLQDLSVLCLNVTPPASAYLFTTMQATVAARNDNGRVGVYYDKVDVYAQYKDVAITVPTRLPVEYQGHYDQSVWSPFLQSLDHVVLPPNLAVALAQDETAGYVLVDIRLDGWVRWKVGTWISGHYHLRVNCPALLTVNDGKGSYGVNYGGGDGYFRFQQAAACAVDTVVAEAISS